MIYKFWGFRIPTSLLLRLKVQSAKHNLSMSSIAIAGITDTIDAMEKTPSQNSGEVENAV
jgi:hypothetical protein